jgi:hypothetical protein
LQKLDIVVYIVVSKLKSKKPPKVTTTIEKVKYLEKLTQYVPSNAMPSHIAKIHRNIKLFGKILYTSKLCKCCHKGILLMSPWWQQMDSIKLLTVVPVCPNIIASCIGGA